MPRALAAIHSGHCSREQRGYLRVPRLSGTRGSRCRDVGKVFKVCQSGIYDIFMIHGIGVGFLGIIWIGWGFIGGV